MLGRVYAKPATLVVAAAPPVKVTVALALPPVVGL
jgi:hypothetical protein